MHLVTVLREPRQRMVSYFYYYIEPVSHAATLDRWLAKDAWQHTLAVEFGLYNESDLDGFMRDYADKFAFIALSDRMDDSMVAMALQFGWNLADVTYLRLLDSHTARGSTRFDGRPLKPTPALRDLPPATLAALTKITRLDQV